MESTEQSQFDRDEVNLNELFAVLWEGRWILVCVTAVCTLAAATAAWLVPKKYTAEIVISPVTDTPGANGQFGRLSSLASQFGGLASLAGISVGNDQKKAESLAVLQSGALTERYIEDNDLLPVLYESKWDAQKKQWRVRNPKKTPTLWKANQFFKKKIRTVINDSKSGLVTLTITWKDPQMAAKWANDLVRMANDHLRDKAIRESERNIAYLNVQAAKTDVVAVKQAIYSIMETEINKAMLARGSEEYALKVIDPAQAPERPSFPQPVLWTIGGLFAGLLMSVLITLIRPRLSRRSS